ncbi:MAG TPA: 4-hydroxy-2-oxoheptanedioate aldolase [Steroidobacteraceae bacterium]
MLTPTNTFKAALRQGATQFGLWVGITDSICVEIAAGAGFDWLLLDAEHAPNDVRTLLIALQTVAAYPVRPLVRVPSADPIMIKRVLDIGAQSLLVPMVETADQARQLVAAMRYPPEGFRGVGTGLARAARWNRVTDYFKRANAEMCLIVQIETQAGLDSIEAIAAVDGVDALFVGPADLAAALGHLGQRTHPAVREAVRAAFQRIRATGKACGSISSDEAVARNYLDQGCQFVALGVDTTLLAAAQRSLVQRFKPDAGG